MQTQLDEMANAYAMFTDSANGQTTWEQYYARGHCKLAKIGVTYSQYANNGAGVRICYSCNLGMNLTRAPMQAQFTCKPKQVPTPARTSLQTLYCPVCLC